MMRNRDSPLVIGEEVLESQKKGGDGEDEESEVRKSWGFS